MLSELAVCYRAQLCIGSGKTLIAVLLLRYMLDRELENRQLRGYKPKTSFFLVSINS